MCSERMDLWMRLAWWVWCLGNLYGTWRVTQEGATVPTSKSSSTSIGALGLLLILIRALEYVLGIVRTNDYIYCGAEMNED